MVDNGKVDESSFKLDEKRLLITPIPDYDELDPYLQLRVLENQHKIAVENKDEEREIKILDALFFKYSQLIRVSLEENKFEQAISFQKVSEDISEILLNNPKFEHKQDINNILIYDKAIISETVGLSDLFDKSDYINAPNRLEYAAKMYEESSKENLEIDETGEIKSQFEGIAFRVRAFSLLGQGLCKLNAADTKEAQELFKKSINSFDIALNKSMPAFNKFKTTRFSEHHPDYLNSFKLYVESYIYQAQADESAYNSNYQKCASLLNKRIMLLKQSIDILTKHDDPLAQTLIKKMTLDKELTDIRFKHFNAKSIRKPKNNFTLGSIIFVLIAIILIVIQLGVSNVFGIKIDDQAYLIIGLIAILIAGVGAGIASWTDISNIITKKFGG